MAISEREIKSWAAWMRAANHPETTIGLRTYHLRRALREINVDPWAVSIEDLVTWLASKEWKASTRRTYRTSLRGFYGWAQAAGRRLDSPAHLLPTVTLPRSLPRPAPESVYREALLAADSRAWLMIQLAAVCGMRRGEISRVRRDDVTPDLVGHSLLVHGKGSHERLVPLPDDLARVLLQASQGCLFPSPRGGSLTPAHVGKIVSRLLPEKWTCHTLRHRCATVAYASTRDLRAVQELLGHAKPETTMLYTLIPAASIREAMEAAAA